MADNLKADVKADVSLSSAIIFSGATSGLHSLIQFTQLGDELVKAEGGKLYLMRMNDGPRWVEVKG